ncbi:uncharacterized protein LOC114544894, partial [Dendronephthya gigantea]
FSEIQDIVGSFNGKWKVDFKDTKIDRTVQYEFTLPADETKQCEIEEHLDSIDMLINEEMLQTTSNRATEMEDCSSENQKTVESCESESCGESSDESWAPSKDAHVHEESEQGHSSKSLQEDLSVESHKQRKSSGEQNVTAPQRRKISCPLVMCNAKVVHLPRHMRNVHHWTKEAASKVLLKYNIRQRLTKEPKKKDYRCRRKCPIDDCHSIVRRLPKHLQKVHKLDKASTMYQRAIVDAPVAPNRKHAMIKWQEEQLKRKTWEVDRSHQHRKEQEEEDEEEQDENKEVIGENKRGRYDHDDDDDHNDDDDDHNDDDDDDDDDDNDDGSFNDDDGDDDDEDESSSMEDVKQQTKSTLPPVITEFQEWLASPDGSKKDEKTVMQHGSQLYILLKAIDDSENIQSLFDLKLIRQVFLNVHVKQKKYEAGTIKSYLMSLRHFFSFVLSDKPESIKFNWVDVSSAREKVKMWSASYKRESNTRKWQKLEEDMLNRLTPSNIRKLEKSAAAREAIKIIGQYSDSAESTPVTQSSYTLVRDFLFTQIFIDNANRPGVLAHMTMEEFTNIRKQDDHYLITVKKHKTAHVHGPARVVLSEKLKSWMSVFVGVMRAHVTTRINGPVFLSWNGNGMNSGHITKAVQSVFKKAGVDVKITCTSFRKAAVTKVHIDKPEMKKSKTSIEASRNLGRLMRTDDGGGDILETATTVEETMAVDGKGKSSPCESSESESKRAPWTDDDVAKIKKIFQKDILKNNVTLDVVRHGVETHEELCGMSPRRIYDKLKKEGKKNLGELVPVMELPQEHDSLEDKLDRMEDVQKHAEESGTNDDQLSTSIIAPTERNSLFNCDEVQTIQKLFEDMIRKTVIISKVEVEKRCSGSRDGRSLLQKSTPIALVNRIKYERRKHRLAKNVK